MSHRPRTRADIPTPALLVDIAAMDRNIRRMAAYFSEGHCKLRPHFKAHKTPEIARRQLAAGSCTGITCSTVSEAESVAAFAGDILVANEIVDPDKCHRAAILAKTHAVTVAIDSIEGLECIAGAALDAGVTIRVLVDLNVGQNRCGVAPGDEAVALGTRAMATSGVVLHGLMGYEGHAVGIPARAERESAVRYSMEQLAMTARMFAAAGLPTIIVSGGGTGSYDISSTFKEITEIQAGSYVLMDADYAKFGIPFEHAASILGTVVSRAVPDRCVSDSGHKACTKDHGLPAVKGIDGATVLALNDEHATIAIPSASTLAIGDRIELFPSHIDPTMNLHDVVYALDGEIVVDVWPITARGYAEHRRA